MTVLFFLASLVTLAGMFLAQHDSILDHHSERRRPEASLRFLFYGAGILMLLVIAGYTVRKYWIFRGKATKLHG